MYEETRKQIIAESRTWEGTPFLHQGRVKGLGVDCGGIIYCVYTDLNLIDIDDLKRYPRVPDPEILKTFIEQVGTRVSEDLADSLPGDVLLFRVGRRETHLAIYTGNNNIIHAAEVHRFVQEHELNQKWLNRFVAVYRLKEFID